MINNFGFTVSVVNTNNAVLFLSKLHFSGMAIKKQRAEIWYGFYFEGDEYYAFEQRRLPVSYLFIF